MNIEPENFRTYRIQMFNGGQKVYDITDKLYIFYPKEKDNYSVHFILGKDGKHVTLYGDAIIVEEM